MPFWRLLGSASRPNHARLGGNTHGIEGKNTRNDPGLMGRSPSGSTPIPPFTTRSLPGSERQEGQNTWVASVTIVVALNPMWIQIGGDNRPVRSATTARNIPKAARPANSSNTP
jgi:hypothetical protein